MSKYLSAKIYQENNERLQKKKKKTRDRYQNLSNEEKEKKRQCGRERYWKFQKMRNKSLLSIEKNIVE